MARKRKVRGDRILISVLAIILLALLVVLGFKYLFNKEDEDPSKQPSNNETVESLKISVNSYDVYQKNDELGFGFIIADLHFENNEPIINDLSSLVSDEGINLANTSSYEKKLRTSNYDFDSLGVINDINVTSNTCDVKVFIPFILANNNVAINDMDNDNSLVFDINTNTKNIDSIKKAFEEETISSKDYSFACGKPYIEDMMKYNGEPYESSMLSIYCFRITCNEIKDGVKVTNAYFVDSNGTKTEAYGEEYSSSKIDNIINKNIKAGDTYALFFELYSNEDDKVTYNGKIVLSFSDNTTAEVETVMN